MKALTAADIDGERFILISKQYSFKDFSDVLSTHFSKKGYKSIVSFVAPNFSIKLLAKCGNKDAKSIVNILGLKSLFDRTKTDSKLGVFNSLTDNDIRDLVQSAIHHQIIPDKSKNNELTNSWKTPDLDISAIPRAEIIVKA